MFIHYLANSVRRPKHTFSAENQIILLCSANISNWETHSSRYREENYDRSIRYLLLIWLLALRVRETYVKRREHNHLNHGVVYSVTVFVHDQIPSTTRLQLHVQLDVQRISLVSIIFVECDWNDWNNGIIIIDSYYYSARSALRTAEQLKAFWSGNTCCAWTF